MSLEDLGSEENLDLYKSYKKQCWLILKMRLQVDDCKANNTHIMQIKLITPPKN